MRGPAGRGMRGRCAGWADQLGVSSSSGTVVSESCRALRLGQRVDVVHAVVAPAVDEKRRGARHAALVGAGDVLADPLGVRARAQLVPEAIDVEAKVGGVPHEVPWRQLTLMGEE